MQFQADLIGMPVDLPEITETTALGAACLAGIAVGFWRDQQEVSQQWRSTTRYEPRISSEESDRLYSGWQRAMEQARDWEKPT